MKSPVYFWNLRASLKAPYPERIKKLLKRTGFAEHVAGGELTAVKIHFGERGVTSHVQPLMIKPIIDFLLKAGAKPFLTDASTLYVGQRGEAVSHSMQAALHGFDPLLLGAPVIIADGLKGASQEALRVKGGKHVKKAFIAADIANADLLVSINHAKGHELAGFGGALKNIGMGSASKQGKMQQHVTTGPAINLANCKGCGACVGICAAGALALADAGSAKPAAAVCSQRRRVVLDGEDMRFIRALNCKQPPIVACWRIPRGRAASAPSHHRQRVFGACA